MWHIVGGSKPTRGVEVEPLGDTPGTRPQLRRHGGPLGQPR